MDFGETFLWGIVGSFALELLRLSKRLRGRRPPQTWRVYAVAALVDVLLGGICASFHAAPGLARITPAQLGVSPPTLGAWASATAGARGLTAFGSELIPSSVLTDAFKW